MSNSVGAPGNVPSAGLDVAADLLQIGNRRAETVTLGKYTDSTGAQVYRGIEIINFPNAPLAQPSITIGNANALGVGGQGSSVICVGRTIVIAAENDLGGPGTLSLNGDVNINGAPIAPAPAYLEVARSLPATVPGAYVDFNEVLGSAGTSVTRSDPTTFTFSKTGSYEITWKVTTDTLPPSFGWELQSGAITAPTAKAFPLPVALRLLETTVSETPAPGLVYGQFIVTVSVGPAALKLKVFSVGATYYVANGNRSASVIVRQIAN